jgi:hypothetical protein
MKRTSQTGFFAQPEGHNAVRDLRGAADESLDLEQPFLQVVQEFPLEEELDFRVIVQGKSRLLHPLLCQEVYRIGREASANASCQFRRADFHFLVLTQASFTTIAV